MREPLVITARHPGVCSCGCNRPFSVGDQIYWRKGFEPTIFKFRPKGGVDMGNTFTHCGHPTVRVRHEPIGELLS